MQPSYRLHPPGPALPAVAHALADVPTPNISDSLGKLSPAGAALKPMHRGGRMIGRATTVRVPAGDNLLAYKGILAASPGDVLVIDAGGCIERATIGEMMSTWAAARGLAGIVVHGAVRDIEVLRAADFPVYACGFTHRGPAKNGSGELNAPVSLGGMLVSPGDLMVGDANGVVAVPHADIGHVVEAVARVQAREEQVLQQMRAGSYDGAWIDAALRTAGYAL